MSGKLLASAYTDWAKMSRRKGDNLEQYNDSKEDSCDDTVPAEDGNVVLATLLQERVSFGSYISLNSQKPTICRARPRTKGAMRLFVLKYSCVV